MEIPYKGQVISDEFDLTNPMFREECQIFLVKLKSTFQRLLMLRRGQGDNHPTQNGLNIGLEESQHQSLLKSTISGQHLHQIALSEIYFNTELGQPHHFSVLKYSDLNQ